MLIIKNLTRSRADEKFLKLVVDKALKNLPKLAKNGKMTEVGLVVIGEKRMKGLNQVWRGKNKVTDVLSFGNEERNEKNKFIAPENGVIHLGQIFICYPVASRQARQYGYTLREEMARLLVHGILHLAGFDHEKILKRKRK